MKGLLRIGIAVVAAGVLLPPSVLSWFTFVSRPGHSEDYGWAIGVMLYFWFSLAIACALLGIGSATLAVGLLRAKDGRPILAIAAALIGALGFMTTAVLLPLMAKHMS